MSNAEIASTWHTEESLPDPLPESPMLLCTWFDEMVAAKHKPNPDSMVLGTVDAEGRPRARVVLCRKVDPEAGYLQFYTNYWSDKGREIEANPVVSATFHWDHVSRQARLEGRVVRAPEAESDAYFAKRYWTKRIGAWASAQSQPIGSRDELIASVGTWVDKLGLDLKALLAIDEGGPDVEIPRPPHWGGFRIWIDRLELWCEGEGRVHDRGRWHRELTEHRDGETHAYTAGAWSATRLQP